MGLGDLDANESDLSGLLCDFKCDQRMNEQQLLDDFEVKLMEEVDWTKVWAGLHRAKMWLVQETRHKGARANCCPVFDEVGSEARWVGDRQTTGGTDRESTSRSQPSLDQQSNQPTDRSKAQASSDSASVSPTSRHFHLFSARRVRRAACVFLSLRSRRSPKINGLSASGSRQI